MPVISSPAPPPVLTPVSDRVYRVVAALFFLALALVYYLPSMRWLPRGIHEWAQADRLALAISFYDRGMDFFRPQTLTLNSVDGVTGVEFPLLPYLAALGAKLTGRPSLVVWYRGLTILTACIGHYYLFRLVFERTRRFVAALLPGVLLATSPVFAYYAGNFLPDSASTSLSLVGAYYLLQYYRLRHFSCLAIAIGVFTLATLIKTSGGIYLVAALSLLLLWSYFYAPLLPTRQKAGLLALAVLSLAAVVGYALFNRYLNERYHSDMFLATIRPIETPQQFRDIAVRIKEVWQVEYFTPVQYLLLKASGIICLLSLRRLLRTEWLWVSLLLLAAVGGWLFYRLMGLQLLDHDYYVLAPLWPAAALLIALATVRVAAWSWLSARVSHALFAAGILALLLVGIPQYRARMHEPYRNFSGDYTYHWMEGGAQKLADAHIPLSDNLFVLGESAPNLSLVYFDRRGIIWRPEFSQTPAAEILGRMTTYGLDCLVMRQAVFQDFQRAYPDLMPAFSIPVTTDQYVVLKRRQAPPHW